MERAATMPNIGLSAFRQRQWCGMNCPLRTLHGVPQDSTLLEPIRWDTDAFSSGGESSGASQSMVANGVFTPLTEYQTRLIALQPGPAEEPIQCNLIPVNIIDGRGCAVVGSNKIVTYEAVSYSWGRSKASCVVMINGNAWGVSEELAYALLYLRLPDKERYLWCDALCIHQENLTEKALQIKSMLRIFEKADRVLAWLGKPLDFTKRLCSAFQMIDGDVQMLMQQQHDEICQEVVESLALTLRHHLASQWFLRTWIRQEVFAAGELVLHFGSHELVFDRFLERLEAIHQLCSPGHNLVRSIPIPPTFLTLKREYKHMGTDDPAYKSPREQATFVIHTLRILRSGSLFQVTDDKDRIYGMLGILTSHAAKFEARLPDRPAALAAAYPVDYAQSVSVVFENVIKYLINQTHRLGILDVFRRSHNNNKLASWAIDWREFKPGSSSVYVLFDNNKFNEEKTPENLLPYQDYNDTGKLRLMGVVALGKLSHINGPKELNHPRYRFTNKPKADVLFSDFVKPRPHIILSAQPKLRIVAARFEEEGGLHQLHLVTRRLWTEGPAIEDLTSDNYAFAYTDERSIFRLHKFHYLVPRQACLDDIIVSFCGSMMLQLIRKVQSDPDEYIYLGPVAAVISESDLEDEFGLKSTINENRHTSAVKTTDPGAESFRRQVFVLR